MVELFLAEQGGRVVGRVAGIDDANHNAAHGDNLAFFGYFEAETENVAHALYGAVEAWARARGRSLLRGPANPSMNDSSGFQLSGYGSDPYLMTPTNPPSYPRYAEAAGYSKAKDLYAWFFDHRTADFSRIARLAARAEKRYRPTVRGGDMAHFGSELATLKRLYNGAWEENWGFVRYTDAEFDALGRELKFIVDPDLVLFIDLGGEPVGVALSLPDVNQVLKKMKGRLLPLGWLYLLRRKQLMTQARLPILGVVKEHRHKGLELVLIHETLKRSRAKGYLQGECSWILEDNDGINKGIAATGATLYKTYRLYQKTL